MNTAQDFASFGQGNVEAFVRSSQILATGMQDMSKQMAATAQSSMEEMMATFRAMVGVRSIKDAMDMQATLARTTVEKAMAQTSHVAEASFKLAEQAIAPIAGRVTLAVESFSKAAGRRCWTLPAQAGGDCIKARGTCSGPFSVWRHPSDVR